MVLTKKLEYALDTTFTPHLNNIKQINSILTMTIYINFY